MYVYATTAGEVNGQSVVGLKRKHKDSVSEEEYHGHPLQVVILFSQYLEQYSGSKLKEQKYFFKNLIQTIFADY